MGITIRVEGEVAALQQRLSQLANINLRGVNLALSEALRISTIERFQSKKDPDGRRWTPSIRAISEGGETLTKDSYLKNSIKSEASSSGFAVGTNIEYAATHQFGDEGRVIRAKNSKNLKFKIAGKWRSVKQVKVEIPKRAFLGISEDDMQEIRSTVESVISGNS